MNERDEFLRSMHSFLRRSLERIETMNEMQVVNALRAFHAARSNHEVTLSFLKSVSLSPEDICDQSDALRSQLNARARSTHDPFALSNSIEEALTRRLEKLRGKGA